MTLPKANPKQALCPHKNNPPVPAALGEMGILSVLYAISQAAHLAENLDDLYHSIHQALAALMPMENFFIAAFDAENELVSFPYFVDRYDPPPPARKLNCGLTDYVLKTGKPLFAGSEDFEHLMKTGAVDLIGTDSFFWIGVPLKTKKQIIGAMITQTYDKKVPLTQDHLDILTFVSDQVGMAIERKSAEQEIQEQARFLRQVIDINPHIMAAKDNQGRFTLANQALAKVYNLPVESILGKTEFELRQDPDHVLQRQKWENNVFLSQNEKINPEEPFIDSSGRLHTFHTIRRPLVVNGHKDRQMLLVATDITERRQHEKELEVVSRLSASLRKANNRVEMLPIILEELSSLLKASGGIIAELDPLRKEVILTTGIGDFAEFVDTHIPFGQGISWQVMQNGQTYINNDTVLNDPRLYIRNSLEEDYKAICLPLCAQAKSLGVLWVFKKEMLTESDQRFSSAIADIAANAIHRASLHEETENRLRNLNALHQIDLAISSNHDLDKTLQVVLTQVVNELNVDAADILIFSPQEQDFRFAAGYGFYTDLINNTKISLYNSLAGRAGLEKNNRQYPGSFKRKNILPARVWLLVKGFAPIMSLRLLQTRKSSGFWRYTAKKLKFKVVNGWGF